MSMAAASNARVRAAAAVDAPIQVADEATKGGPSADVAPALGFGHFRVRLAERAWVQTVDPMGDVPWRLVADEIVLCLLAW